MAEVKAQDTTSLASIKTVNEAATESRNLLSQMQTAAEAADTTLTAIYQDAEDAKTNAEAAQASAESASEYAARALGNLSTVQSVTETLNWITSHGTMTLTTDTALDPTHVYFVQDNNGDYTVGGTRYAIVTEPNVADISTYYELSIDESLNNYVATHLAVDSEGLWIVPDAGGNKVLIATGQGTTYTSAGTYIVGKVNNVDTVLAQFTADGTQIGQTGESHLEIDYHSLQLIARGETTPFFWVSDLRDKDDNYQATMTETFTADGVTDTFSVQLDVYAEVSATDSSHSSNTVTRNGRHYTFATTPSEGATVTIVYKTKSDRAKAYTLGRRASGDVGAMSVAEGGGITASGYYSHAEGTDTIASGYASHAEGFGTTASGMGAHAEGGAYNTASGGNSHAEGYLAIASGICSHAEGFNTTASGNYAHAQNYSTAAGYNSQTAIGKYNDNQSDNAFEIGNGTSDTARSNAFTVDWSGNVNASGDVTDGSGNMLSDMVAKSLLLDFCHPVGSSYETVDADFNPNVSWGGTWELLPEGTIILAGSESGTYKVGADTSTDSGYKEYGDNEHLLTDQEIAHGHGFTQPTVNGGAVTNGISGGGHSHTITSHYKQQNAASGSARNTPNTGAQSATNLATIGANTGTHTHSLPAHTHSVSGGAVDNLHGASSTRTAHSVMQKSIAMYIWIRTA